MKKENQRGVAGGWITSVITLILLGIATSCEISPSAEEINEPAMAASEIAAKQFPSTPVSYLIKYVDLKMYSTGIIRAGSIKVEIRDETGQTVIASAIGPYVDTIFPEPGFIEFDLNTALVGFRKTRLYVTRTKDGANPIFWTGANGPIAGDAYPQGVASAAGDFNFATKFDRGISEQVSNASGPGELIKFREYQWQEFITGSTLLTRVDLMLGHNLDSPEDILVDIRSADGSEVIATSYPVSTTLITGGWVTFVFPKAVIVNKSSLYQIYPRRTWFSVFPFIRVYWNLNRNNAYAHGASSAGNNVDFAFKTYINGQLGATQQDGSGIPPENLNSNSSQWQQFIVHSF